MSDDIRQDGPAGDAIEAAERDRDMRRAAMNWLARRDFAREEMAGRLRRKFGEAAPVEAVLQWLEEQGFLDEARFAHAFVRSRVERGQGELRIRQALSRRGIPDAVMDEALEAQDCDWFALARSVHQRRFRRGPGADRKEKARQLRFLQYRGFSSEQCFAAVEAADSED